MPELHYLACSTLGQYVRVISDTYTYLFRYYLDYSSIFPGLFLLSKCRPNLFPKHIHSITILLGKFTISQNIYANMASLVYSKYFQV